MADISSTLRAWSATAASNAPSGSTAIGGGLDDNLREIQAVVRAYLAGAPNNIASATPDLSNATTNYVNITGTTTITSFGTVSSGIHHIIKFADALTLTHNATSLILPGGANITTAAGDMMLIVSEGSGNWRCINYTYASGLTVASATGSATPTPTEIRIATTDAASDWSTTLPWGRLSFHSGDGTGGGPKIHAAIDAVAYTVNGGASHLSFKTQANNADTLTERFRVLAVASTGGSTLELTNSTGLQIAHTDLTDPVSTDGNVYSGTYTPTLFNTTNVAASTANVTQYMRVGNVVTVAGQVDIDPTAGSTDTILGMSLPVASAFTTQVQAGGTLAILSSTVTANGCIYADTTNDRLNLRLIVPDTSNRVYQFHATYRVV